MKRNFMIALGLVLVLALSVIGYGLYANYKSEHVIMERMNSRSVTVSVAEVKPRSFRPIRELPEAIFNTRRAVDVISKVDGIISANYVHKNKAVKPGEVLFELTNEEVPMRIGQATAELKKAQTLALRAKNRFERYGKLVHSGAVSLEQYDEAKSSYESAVSDVENAQMQYEQRLLSKDRLQVRTDVAGSVLIVYKTIGNYVNVGTPICMVGDFEKMWFAINMDDKSLRSLLGEEGAKATFTLSFERPNFDKAYGTEYNVGNKGYDSTFPCNIYGVFPPLSEPAEMRRLVLDVDNRTAVLEAKSYSDMLLTAKQPRTLLSVPRQALRNNGKKYSVFVVTQERKLLERQVELGAAGRTYVEILSGLERGDTVVISGLEGLKNGQRVEVEMEDM